MKTNLFYLVAIIFSVLSKNAFAQDEFYNNTQTTETSSVKVDSSDISSYSTAEDYNTIENDEENNTNEQVDLDNYRDEDSPDEKRRKRERNEFVANMMVDVFINVVFIFATFWH